LNLDHERVCHTKIVHEDAMIRTEVVRYGIWFSHITPFDPSKNLRPIVPEVPVFLARGALRAAPLLYPFCARTRLATPSRARKNAVSGELVPVGRLNLKKSGAALKEVRPRGPWLPLRSPG
jgi:hypothetical protein